MYRLAFILNNEGTEFHRRHKAEPVNERILNLCGKLMQEGADVSFCYTPAFTVPSRIVIMCQEQLKTIKTLEDNPFVQRHYTKLSRVDDSCLI